jgi:hypothetical protein
MKDMYIIQAKKKPFIFHTFGIIKNSVNFLFYKLQKTILNKTIIWYKTASSLIFD